MKNTLGRVANPSFLLASTTAIVAPHPSRSFIAGWVGLHHSLHHLSPSYPHQPERRPAEDIALPVLAADNQPNFRTISDFRKIHLKTLEGLFEQVLRIALEAGALKMGRVALDGTKIKANASKHKAMSYDRMKKKEEDLRSQIKDLMEQPETADAEENAATPVPDSCDTPPPRKVTRRELNRPTQ